MAASRSPVNASSEPTAPPPTVPMPSTRQTAPCGSTICPALSDRSKLLPEHPRRVAEAPRPCPEPDAGSLRLVRIHLPLVPLLPAPGEDRAQPDLLRDVLDGERLPLDHLVPGRSRPEAVTTADSLVAEEAEHETDPGRRDPHGGDRGDRVAIALAQEPVAEDRAERPDLGGRQVDLAHDVGDLCHLTPPRDRVARAGERRLVDQQNRVRAFRREILQERKHVRAVLRGQCAPRRGDRRAEQLVLDDERRRAAPGSNDGPLILILRGSLEGGGIGRRGRRPHLVRHLQVEGVRRGAASPSRRCVVGAGASRGGEQRPRLGQDRQKRRPAILAPHRLLRPDAALAGEHRVRGRAAGREQAGRRNDRNEQEDPLHDQLLCTRESSGRRARRPLVLGEDDHLLVVRMLELALVGE